MKSLVKMWVWDGNVWVLSGAAAYKNLGEWSVYIVRYSPNGTTWTPT